MKVESTPRWRPSGRAASLLLLVAVPVLALFFASNAVAAWTIQTPPVSSSESELEDVSCASATHCHAVGDALLGGGSGTVANRPLFETWSNEKWSSEGSNLETLGVVDVSCPEVARCLAIGQKIGLFKEKVAVGYRGGGLMWEEVDVDGGGLYRVLNSISCVTYLNCFAVGKNTQTGGTLIVKYNGGSWSSVTSPNPAGTSPELTGVSCTSATSCVAVGKYISGGNTLSFSEVWNGTEWKVVTTPNAAAPVSALADVSCSSSSACTAVGRSVNGSVIRPLVERWNGSSWTIQTAPYLGEGAELSGVSCPTSTSCTAAGSYKAGANQYPTALSWNGSGWVIQTVPSPTVPTGSTLQANLNGISCTSAMACLGVGTYRIVTGGVAGKPQQLIERLS
jgi:hypothetical protein